MSFDKAVNTLKDDDNHEHLNRAYCVPGTSLSPTHANGSGAAIRASLAHTRAPELGHDLSRPVAGREVDSVQAGPGFLGLCVSFLAQGPGTTTKDWKNEELRNSTLRALVVTAPALFTLTCWLQRLPVCFVHLR